jgi:hypothetical protein
MGKNFSDKFPIQNVWKKEKLLSCSFSLEYAIEGVLANQEGSKLNGTHQHLVYVVDVNLLSQSVHTIKKNTED